jgi:hypothetical protein
MHNAQPGDHMILKKRVVPVTVTIREPPKVWNFTLRLGQVSERMPSISYVVSPYESLQAYKVGLVHTQGHHMTLSDFHHIYT